MRALFPITLFLISAPLISRLRRSPSLRPPRNCSTLCDWRISTTGPMLALTLPRRKRFSMLLETRGTHSMQGSASSDRTASNTLFLKHRRN